ncbi:DNA methyltransferase [Streptococcus sp. HMSC065H07]|uniref:DNA methyltransferase n=1 Tax=Streptococcus sp. HMSC065H07 TaxID=1715116 RepID=UPI0008A9068D|nr:DNA methyltransferase [Streptococcus sp. HMSC065H07]OHQ22669.1 methylase [Streptococcus sp. HMSC065H07]
MNTREQKKQAKAFIKRWENRGSERQDSQSFWLDLLQSVYGIENPTEYITFEDKVMLDHTSFIDGFIDKTKVLIEQKGANKDLNKAIRQSDGTYLTPFQQAKRYSANTPYSRRPRWIITCNFKEFYIYDMEQPNGEPKVVQLADLDKEAYRLEFLVDKTNEHLEREMKVSMEAGEIVGEIYDGLLKQYVNPDNPDSLHAINQLVVRLVFCLYAEDAGIFGHKMMFHDYLARFGNRDFRRGLMDLFSVLDTPIDTRDPYLDSELNAFPYVNGGMFAENNLEIPNFTDELRELILEHASSSFDWSEISPTIFGAVFESTLNPETRRSGGMHYTSIENIHKVIDPLFLDELKEELNEIRQFKQPRTVEQKAKQFQSKLANLLFFDPACGSGNFLTETYISLRRLENEAIKLYMGDTVALDLGQDLVKVKLKQFYGIEINDFAVSVAKTALWIAESQMLEETKDIVFANIDFLPLKSYTNIVEGNALEIDWESVVPKDKLNYIIGNPPFVGHSLQSSSQKSEIKAIFVDENRKPYRLSGKIDYVAGWYFKASELMHGTDIRTAFVSTNSITQGEQVSGIWKPLIERFGVKIDFAWRSFVWSNEASEKAKVHCVIIGFSTNANVKEYALFDNELVNIVSGINPYLVEGDNIFVESRRDALFAKIPMYAGGKPTDGGNLILTVEEKDRLVEKNRDIEKFLRPFLMGADFIKRKPRYCIWLHKVNPSEFRKIPEIMERVKKVQEFRLNSPSKITNKKAERATEFDEIRESASDYLAFPKVSSENRRYVPIDYLSKEVIPGDKLFMVPNASLYDFGILTSNVHMAWMRTVAGRMKSDYSYSNTVVYNNFPIPDFTDKQKEKIRNTAKGILEARNLYPDASFADLYDELTMPKELRRAHQANDKAVMEAYGLTKIVDGKKTWLTESETVARLFELYEQMTNSKS